MIRRGLLAAMVSGLLILLSCSGRLYANLLTNGGFENGPYGVQIPLQPMEAPPVPGQWYAETMNAGGHFDGIFDSSWHLPPQTPGFPTNFGPFEGSYFLGRYRAPNPNVTSKDGIQGSVYQQVPVTAGKIYYASAWLIGFDPHGFGTGVRIGIDPTGAVDPLTNRPRRDTPDVKWFPSNDLNGGAAWESVDRFWKRVQVQAQATPADPTNPKMTIWVRYYMPASNLAAPQVVQIDNVNLSEKALDIYMRDVTVTGSNYSPVTQKAAYRAQWRVTDGSKNVNANCTFHLGSTNLEITRDAATGIYSVNLNDLNINSTYNFTITASYAGCDSITYNGSFQAFPVLALSEAEFSDLSEESITISWSTTDRATGAPVATYGRVEYGKDGYTEGVDDTSELKTNHSVTLTQLLPGTIYKFRTVSERPEPNPDPYAKSIRTKKSNSSLYQFQTNGGDFWNGDFEMRFVDPVYRDDEIPGWTKFAGIYGGEVTWYFNGDWHIPSHKGNRYVLQPSNYGGPPQSGLYQNFKTTPDNEHPLVFSAWVWAESYAPKGLSDKDSPHRFGDTRVKIGIDPMGGTNPNSGDIIWSAARETLDWDRYTKTGSYGHGWQRVQVAALPKSDHATLFLKNDALWGNNWVMCGFDDVTREPGPTAVTSVAQAKTLENDSVIKLSGDVVVTHIVADNTLYSENRQNPYFYIQDEDGTAGIKVTMAVPGTPLPAIAVGQKVSIEGMITHGVFLNHNEDVKTFYDQQLRMNKPAGERVINALTVTPGEMGKLPRPVTMSNKHLCGSSSTDHWFQNPGVWDGVGPNNVGRLVRIFGKVIDAGVKLDNRYLYRCYMVIDDGNSVPCYGSTPDNPLKGVYIDCDSFDMTGHIGDFAIITGISAVTMDYDWDDPVWASPGTNSPALPQAMKNVRTIKPLSFNPPDVVFMPVQH